MGIPAAARAANPPKTGFALGMPALIIKNAARALVASSGQVQ